MTFINPVVLLVSVVATVNTLESVFNLAAPNGIFVLLN